MHQHRHHHHDDEVDDHDRGLAFDLQTLISRRQALRVIAGGALSGIALASLAACGSGEDDATAAGAAATTSGAATGATSTTAIPEETAGPYPGDGSNGVNVLTESGIVRSDIRSSFGTGSAVAEGVPLTVTLTVVDSASDGVPLAGAAVYLWHCDRDGRYSMYAEGLEDENYLRGVQEADANGQVTFTTIYPAAYSGRWPHIHFEVYPSVDDATAGTNIVATSQLAFPEDVCDAVYSTADGYQQSVQNLAQTSLDRDMVFGDGYDTQLATVTGSVEQGYVATLAVPV